MIAFTIDLVYILLCLAALAITSSCQYISNERPQDQRILEHLLRSYDQRVRPPPTNYVGAINESFSTRASPQGPVLVRVNVLMRMLSK